MSADDQRRYSRFAVSLSAFITVVPDDDASDAFWYRRRSAERPAIITDLSACGLHFISENSYETSSQVWVSIMINEKAYPIRVMIRRQNSYMREGKTIYGHGVQFLRSDFATAAVQAVMDYLDGLIKSKR